MLKRLIPGKLPRRPFTMAGTIFFLLTVLGIPQNADVGRNQAEKLVDLFLKEKGVLSYQAALRLARIPEIARDVIDSRLKREKDESARERLSLLRRRVLKEGLKRVIVERTKSGLVFSGQWKDLAEYDPEVGKLLLELAKDPLEDPSIREAAVNAIADLGLKKLKGDLRALTEDILNPDWLLDAAGLALAELGDRWWIDRRIASLEKIVRDPAADVTYKYAAFKELARYYYRAKEYRKAIKAYEGAVEILEGRLKTLDEKRALQVRQVLWLTYYNTACSACKAGLLDAAFDYLEKAIKTNPTPQSARELENNIQHDGDLRKLRGDPRYMDLLKKLRALYRAKRVET